ncbi:glycosyltransferase family 4 protein [Clostridium thermobutyricum]|uniref:Glycosyl transferases group 1 n=1 Tax=Clostridium thermobutyricum DSM 4928 TaxID=1121339 RepID=A0A1V4SVH1_9CLOT|nr:glycosyltransferase family 4 protein [Clostridium thermobutyricum]OPX47473.1 glycosyl transferases group 1 [Clostridium thermobutyricum DSM 4928]
MEGKFYNKKILFLVTRPIYPITGGREVVLYNYCKGLCEIFGAEVNLAIFTDFEKINNKMSFIKKQYRISQPNKLEKLKNIILQSFILRKWPLQVSIYYSKKSQKNFQNIVDEIKPDIIICDMARTAEYVSRLKESNAKRILDMDDLISKRYFRQLENVDDVNIFGQYKNRLPKIFLNLVDRNIMKKIILTLEGNLLKKYEKDISINFKNIIFVSPKESNEFNKITNSNKSICITIGVDFDYYSRNVVKEKKENTICFLGNMNIPHNQTAVEHFIKNIFPKIKLEIPECKFRIVGKCSEEYFERFKDKEDVIVTGEVDDIRKYIQDCSVSIAPLIYGSGIKTKILETMAMGVPIVTNSIGAEGIYVTSGKDIFVCDDINDFVINTINLIKDKELNRIISNNAKTTIETKYQWTNTLKNMQKILE